MIVFRLRLALRDSLALERWSLAVEGVVFFPSVLAAAIVFIGALVTVELLIDNGRGLGLGVVVDSPIVIIADDLLRDREPSSVSFMKARRSCLLFCGVELTDIAENEAQECR